jgi:hypothetical protein
VATSSRDPRRSQGRRARGIPDHSVVRISGWRSALSTRAAKPPRGTELPKVMTVPVRASHSSVRRPIPGIPRVRHTAVCVCGDVRVQRETESPAGPCEPVGQQKAGGQGFEPRLAESVGLAPNWRYLCGYPNQFAARCRLCSATAWHLKLFRPDCPVLRMLLNGVHQATND